LGGHNYKFISAALMHVAAWYPWYRGTLGPKFTKIATAQMPLIMPNFTALG